MSGPWQSRAEFLVDQALESALAATDDELRMMRSPSVPQELFPPRVGYQSQPWTVYSVLNIDRIVPTHRSWMSGMPVMRSTMSDQSWGGSARNAFTEGVF